MSQSQTIALDAMGGDHAPDAIVRGAALALESISDVKFLFFGDRNGLAPLLARQPALAAVSEIVHTEEKVRPEDKPSAVLKKGRNTSMALAIAAVAEGRAQSVVSGGNTGALMALAMFTLGRLPGIDRPAIASIFPTIRGRTVVLDLGANSASGAENLVQFAVLGAVFARLSCVSETPSVGLLNVGTEEMKGREEIREACAILRRIGFPGEFKGFVEGSDIPHGTVDVVVTDGFTGNVALKLAEGMGQFTAHFLKSAFRSSLLARIGALFAWPALKALKKQFDPRDYNGGVFLGLNGLCIKSHGGSDPYGVSRAILTAARMVENGYGIKVAAEVSALHAQETALGGAAEGVPLEKGAGGGNPSKATGAGS